MSEENNSGAAAPAAALPPFYSAPEALSLARHGGSGLVVPRGFDFARGGHAVPLAAAEMPAAMRSYPIVFGGPEYMPVAITGIRAGENLFVEADGSWSAPHYVPAYVRRYPFILAGGPKDERLTLCIEPDPARIVPLGQQMAGEAVPEAFFANGEPSDATRRVLAFCEEFQGMIGATRKMAAAVAEAGLFEQRQGRVALDGGEVANITDFWVVNEASLNALSDEAYLDLRRSGALALIYCHLASMNSWQSLIHQAQTRRRAAQAAA